MSDFSEVRTLVVAGSPLARAGLSSLLDDADQINVVGGVGDETDLLDSVDVYHPDVIIWDMEYEPMSSLDKIIELGDAACVVALTADKGTAVEAAPALLGAGVKGLLLQATTSSALAAAVQATSEGLIVLDRDVAAALHPQGMSASAEAAGIIDSLTAREMEVVGLIAEGLPNKSIAIKLGISEHTVKFHVNAILTKLGAQSRTEAVVRATRLGLITL